MQIPYFWCNDHIEAAKKYAEKYTQYNKWIEKSKTYRLKRNTGSKGFTWFRKDDLCLGFIQNGRLTAYSGHSPYQEGWTFNWCSCSLSAFEEVA